MKTFQIESSIRERKRLSVSMNAFRVFKLLSNMLSQKHSAPIELTSKAKRIASGAFRRRLWKKKMKLLVWMFFWSGRIEFSIWHYTFIEEDFKSCLAQTYCSLQAFRSSRSELGFNLKKLKFFDSFGRIFTTKLSFDARSFTSSVSSTKWKNLIFLSWHSSTIPQQISFASLSVNAPR